MPHVSCTAELPGSASPAGAAGPAPWHDSSPEHPHSLKHNLDEHDSLKKRRFDQMVEVRITRINGPTYPIAQARQPSSIGNPSHPRAESVHYTVQGRADRTYQLAC
jgi:hypothetical protein